MEKNFPFYRRTKMKSDKVMESFNMRHIQKMGLTHLGFSLSSTDIAYKIIPDAAKDI